MLLKLIRQPNSKVSIHGKLWIVDPIVGNQPLCDTLENANYIIPELIYPVHVTHSPKFKRLLPIINNVPGRDGIRIHAGNQANDSMGCILIGHANGNRLTDSRTVETMVTKLLLSIDQTHEDIRLEVTHFTPPTPGYPETDHTHRFDTPSAHEYSNYTED